MQTKPEIAPVMFTVQETMAYANVGRATVFKLLKTKQLPRVKLCGKTLISRAAVDRLLGLAPIPN